MTKNMIEFSIDELEKISQIIYKKLKNCKIITFDGPLGAGKTTMIKYLLHLYGVKDEIVSPTYTYLNIYENNLGIKFYHFDLYRISNIDDFLIAGFDEYFSDQNGICLIEWPEIIEPLIKIKHKKVCQIKFDYSKERDKRIIKISIK